MPFRKKLDSLDEKILSLLRELDAESTAHYSKIEETFEKEKAEIAARFREKVANFSSLSSEELAKARDDLYWEIEALDAKTEKALLAERERHAREFRRIRGYCPDCGVPLGPRNRDGLRECPSCSRWLSSVY
ncbi:hypothetical protein IJ380_02850 [Candidatus Saccharibacteria bacterium]|nr:hypothetical protein [Candidatus Saccharibacteria bacterium]